MPLVGLVEVSGSQRLLMHLLLNGPDRTGTTAGLDGGNNRHDTSILGNCNVRRRP